MHSERKTGTGLAGLATAAVVALFGLFMAGYFVPAYEGTDQNGYLCSARRIALTGSAAKHTAHSLEYVTGNVVKTGPGLFYAKYPLGYPWLCAAAYRLCGPVAAFVVNPVLAALAIVGIFLLARALVNTYAGVLAAILLATSPWHTYLGLSALSHSGAIAFAIWGMYYLWRWVEGGGRGNALAAGALTATTYTIRYSEALLALPVIAMVVWRYFQLPEGATPTERNRQVARWRQEVGLLLIGVAVAVLPLLVFQWIAFGAPWQTGYGLCGETTGFGWKWFAENWWLMLTKLNTPGLWLVFPIGLAGLAYVAVHDARRATLLGLWILPPVLLYTAYYWAPQGDGLGYLRFFVSVCPALIVCALILLCEVIPPRPVWSVALGLFVAVAATFNMRTAIKDASIQADRLHHWQSTWTTVRQYVPDGAIIVAAGSVLDSVEFVGNYELYSFETFDRKLLTWRTDVLKKEGPAPFQRLKAEELVNTLGKMNDSQLATLQRSLLTSNVAAGRMLVVLATPDQLRTVRGRLGDAFSYDRLTEWYQVNFTKDDEMRPALWALYRLQPRIKNPPVSESLTGVEEKIDKLQFHVRTLRDEFDEKYPGARQKWDEVTDTEKQIRELRDKAKQLQARPTPSLTSTTTMTNVPTATPAIR